MLPIIPNKSKQELQPIHFHPWAITSPQSLPQQEAAPMEEKEACNLMNGHVDVHQDPWQSMVSSPFTKRLLLGVYVGSAVSHLNRTQLCSALPGKVCLVPSHFPSQCFLPSLHPPFKFPAPSQKVSLFL